MPPRNSKNTKSSGTPVKEVLKASQEVARPAKVSGRDPFIYYMTNLEKAHRWNGDPDYFVHIYREHFLQSFQALSFIKGVKPTDPAVLAQKKVHLPRRETHKDKKTLIFDMDETLIHCNESLDMPSDVVLPITFPNGEVVEAGVNVRPYAIEILKELSQYYEIVVFTASHACYANVVLDYLDPHEQYIHHRLFRDSCVVTEEGVHIKDLRVIANRNLSDMLLIDNAAYSFGFQLENGVPIIPFYDNKSDQELRHLIPYLKFLSSAKDLREINKQTFRLHHYINYDSPDAVLEGVVFQN
jgi:CTD small phosphatase-like protein 2